METAKPQAIGARMGHRVTIKKLEKKLQNGAKVRTHPLYSWRATYVDGGRRRQKYFKIKDAGEDWKAMQEQETLAHGTSANLTNAERSAVIKTRELLGSLDLPLGEAVNFAAEYHQNARQSCTLEELVDEVRGGRPKRSQWLRWTKSGLLEG